MANQTVSSNANFDDAGISGLANGEDITINTGAKLTINSDVRWAQQAAVIGNITIDSTSGGELHVDGTTVWWIKYDGGTSTIPAIGSTVTGSTSGATGELIGLFTDYGVAPSAGGGATPSTGYIKLRSKSGTFQDNENLQVSSTTFAVVNSATGGVRGWLHIVGEESQAITVPRLGTFRITGDWFELETTTSGSRNQTIQLPWADTAPGVWIETSSGSGTYEYWPNIQTGWSTTNISTDARCRFVNISSGGLLRIGSDGTNNLGDLPSSGCKIRVPNILISSSNATDWTANTLNATVGTRWEPTTSSGALIVWDKCMGSGFYPNLNTCYSITISYSAFFDHAEILTNGLAASLTEFHLAPANATTTNALLISGALAGGTMTDCKLVYRVLAGNTQVFTTSNGVANWDFDNVQFLSIGTRTGTGGTATINVGGAENFTFTDCKAYGGGIVVGTTSNITFTNTVYADRVVGTTDSSQAMNLFNLTDVNTITIDGVSFAAGISNVHPYTALFSTLRVRNIKVRNLGTPSARLNLGSANQTGFVHTGSNSSSNIRFQRVYVENTRSGLFSDANTNDGVIYESVWGDTGDGIGFNNKNSILKGIYANGTIATSFSSVYGNHFWDAFSSGTAGKLGIFFNEKTTVEPSASSYSVIAGTPKFTSTGILRMAGASDEIIYEWPHYVLGYTSFTNSAPTVTGTNTGNMTYQYQIDTGSGYGGTWKTLNASNLSGETISATAGFKLKIRITVNAANSSNALTGLQIAMTTDSTSQQTQYPLDSATVTLTGVVDGSRYRIERSSNGALIADGTISGTSVSKSFSADDFPFDIDVIVRKSSSAPKYRPYSITTSFPATGVSIPVSQEADDVAA